MCLVCVRRLHRFKIDEDEISFLARESHIILRRRYVEVVDEIRCGILRPYVSYNAVSFVGSYELYDRHERSNRNEQC